MSMNQNNNRVATLSTLTDGLPSYQKRRNKFARLPQEFLHLPQNFVWLTKGQQFYKTDFVKQYGEKKDNLLLIFKLNSIIKYVLITD